MGIASELVRPGKFTPESLCSCSICLDIPVNPVDLKDCQHTFCKECIDDYIKKSSVSKETKKLIIIIYHF